MSKDEAFVCKCCGQNVQKHKHSLNKGLVSILMILVKGVGPDRPFNLRTDFTLTKSEYTNAQHLKYWGFIKKWFDGDGKRSGRQWILTDKVIEFLKGAEFHEWVKVFNDEVVERSETFVTRSSVGGAWFEPPEVWAKRAETLYRNRQDDLFLSPGAAMQHDWSKR